MVHADCVVTVGPAVLHPTGRTLLHPTGPAVLHPAGSTRLQQRNARACFFTKTNFRQITKTGVNILQTPSKELHALLHGFQVAADFKKLEGQNIQINLEDEVGHVNDVVSP